MKLITSKQQSEIDELNIRKLMFAMRTIYEEFNGDKSGVIKYRDFSLQAENIYYSDNVIYNGYEALTNQHTNKEEA